MKVMTMPKRFITTGLCIPEKHYMVDISIQLMKMKRLVDAGDYFSINRGRQYGKTTNLHQLRRILSREYYVFLISFEGISDATFEVESLFCKCILEFIDRSIFYGEVPGISSDFLKSLFDYSNTEQKIDFVQLSTLLQKICHDLDKPVVFMIDEVDQASNHRNFISFLGVLRDMYLNRHTRPHFQSVILSGVYDIRNLQLKIRPTEAHQVNSPWNIAVKMDIDMSLSKQGIRMMLEEYRQDYSLEFDTGMIASLIYEYTDGYPFLVSRLCELIHINMQERQEETRDCKQWSQYEFQVAVRMLLEEKNTLFESLIGKLYEFDDLSQLLHTILFTGEDFAYNQLNKTIDIATMFGFIKNRGGVITISNRIFELVLYNYFLSNQELLRSVIYKQSLLEKSIFITKTGLDMKKILERFVIHFHDIYGRENDRFVEEEGRKYFLLFLKPIINGQGNYYIEARTRDQRRTDIIVDYQGMQYIIELKIWRGNEYYERGQEQLMDYLKSYHQSVGYMLSFNFNQQKEIGVTEVKIGEYTLIEAVV